MTTSKRMIIERELKQLSAEFSDRLPAEKLAVIVDFYNHDEYALSFDQLVYELDELDQPIPTRVYDQLRALAAMMNIPENKWAYLRTKQD